jgi:hypothetical protein
MPDDADSNFAELLRSTRSLSGEPCWRFVDIRKALEEIADLQRVILGFDIVENIESNAKIWGSTSYDTTKEFNELGWQACISTSLDLALRDVLRTSELTGLNAPFNYLWYVVTCISREEHAKTMLRSSL